MARLWPAAGQGQCLSFPGCSKAQACAGQGWQHGEELSGDTCSTPAEAGAGDTGGPAACQRLCWQTGLAGCLFLPRWEQHLEPFGPGSGCTSMAGWCLGCQPSPKQDRFSVVRLYREVPEGLRGNKWNLWAGWGQADVWAGAQVPHHLYWVWLCHRTRTPLRLKCSPPHHGTGLKPKAAALEKSQDAEQELTKCQPHPAGH